MAGASSAFTGDDPHSSAHSLDNDLDLDIPDHEFQVTHEVMILEIIFCCDSFLYKNAL